MDVKLLAGVSQYVQARSLTIDLTAPTRFAADIRWRRRGAAKLTSGQCGCEETTGLSSPSPQTAIVPEASNRSEQPCAFKALYLQSAPAQGLWQFVGMVGFWRSSCVSAGGTWVGIMSMPLAAWVRRQQRTPVCNAAKLANDAALEAKHALACVHRSRSE